MAVLFFDSSALVKRYAKEPGSAWVRGLTKPKAAHTLYIARITAIEITSAITRKLRGGQLSAAQAGASLGHLRRHLNHRYSILDLAPGLADDAMRLARAHGLKAYDAVQLATALAVRQIYQAAGSTPIITLAPKKLIRTRRASEGSASEPSLARRVSMC